LFSVVPILAIATIIVSSFAFASWYWWIQANQWSARDAFTVWTNQMSVQAPDLLEGTDDEIQSSFATMNLAIESMAGDRNQDGTIAKLKWLSPSEREAAEVDFYDDLLLLAALATERRSQLTSGQTQQLDRWLVLCENSLPLNGARTAERLRLANGDKIYSSLEFGDSSVGSLRGIRMSDGERILQSRAFVMRGHPARSIEMLSEITPRASNKFLYWITVGDAQRKLKHAQAAVLAYGLAINQAPRSRLGYARRSQLLADMRKWDEAEKDCTALIGLNPGNAFRYAERARVRQAMGKIADAIADMDEAIDLEPSANRFYLFRSRLGRDANETIKSKEDYQRGLSLTPRTTEDWVSRALAQLPRHPEKAMADLKRAEQIEPHRFEVLQNQAHVLSEFMHDDNAASQVLKTILDHDPENDWARVDRCVLLARTGRKDEVLEEVENILDGDKEIVPSTYYQIACAYCLLGTSHPECREKALHYLSKAILGGYGHELLETDKDLDSVRLDPQFSSLLQVTHLSQEQAAKHK
jgi:tetratricopeptide (TPR) repeat protein